MAVRMHGEGPAATRQTEETSKRGAARVAFSIALAAAWAVALAYLALCTFERRVQMDDGTMVEEMSRR